MVIAVVVAVAVVVAAIAIAIAVVVATIATIAPSVDAGAGVAGCFKRSSLQCEIRLYRTVGEG